jgi:hypothetical protein
MSAANEVNSTNGKQRRRAPGEGMIRQRPDGRFEGRVTIKGKPKSVYGATLEDVERKMYVAKGNPVPEELIDTEGGSVYFIQAFNGGPIKIGVAGNVKRRLKELQMCCPIPLKVIHIIPGGGRKLETVLHRSFALYRLHGEWFDTHSSLMRFIFDSKKAIKGANKKMK